MSNTNRDFTVEFLSTFRSLWSEYVLADEETLTQEAKDLRQDLLAVVSPTTHAAYNKGYRQGSEDGVKAFRSGFELGLKFVADYPKPVAKEPKLNRKIVRVTRPDKKKSDGN